jgi:hypothetical protein
MSQEHYGPRAMSPEEMQRLFERHRDAEAARDIDAILATFVDDCFLDTHPLGLRSEERVAVRKAYEGYFTAFPDLAPKTREAHSEMTSWSSGGRLREPAAESGWAYLRPDAPFLSPSRMSPRSGMGGWRVRPSTSIWPPFASRPHCRSTRFEQPQRIGHRRCARRADNSQPSKPPESGAVFFFNPDGKLARVEAYQRWDQALEAAGLRA